MRYHYTSQGYQNSLKNYNALSGVKQLLIVNIVIFLLMLLSNPFYMLVRTYFALYPEDVSTRFYLWQCITYLFLHDTNYLLHIIGNMIGLWFLGSELETIWGKKKFFQYYFVVGIGSGLVTAIYMFNFSSNIPVIGASGAIYGLLVAYAILFPNRILYIYGILPLKVKTAAIIFGSIALFYSINISESSGISHITHLAGIVIGFIYLLYWTKQKQSMKIINVRERRQNNIDNLREKNINEILDKINDVGWDALSDEDKKYLEQESKNNHINDPPS